MYSVAASDFKLLAPHGPEEYKPPLDLKRYMCGQEWVKSDSDSGRVSRQVVAAHDQTIGPELIELGLPGWRGCFGPGLRKKPAKVEKIWRVVYTGLIYCHRLSAVILKMRDDAGRDISP